MIPQTQPYDSVEVTSVETNSVKTTSVSVRQTPPGDTGEFWGALYWSDLTTAEQELWTVLGWNEERWNSSSNIPGTNSKRWDAMTSAEQNAARQLGYDQRSWDVATASCPAQPPDEFVETYWRWVNDRDYDTSWDHLALEFKRDRHGNNKSDYINGLNELCEAIIENARTTEQTCDAATVRADLTWKARPSCSGSPMGIKFYLVASSDGRWLIRRTER